jgi:hypothetical protein
MGGSLLDDETRPGQSSAAQAHDAGLVRTLCVAREGAYQTSHEPPTADPHGGWCGGRGLAAPGYPISRHVATADSSSVQGDKEEREPIAQHDSRHR